MRYDTLERRTYKNIIERRTTRKEREKKIPYDTIKKRIDRYG